MTGGNSADGNSQQATAALSVSSTGMTVTAGATDLFGTLVWGKAGAGQPATRTMLWGATPMTELAVFGVSNGTDSDQVSIFGLSNPTAGNLTLSAAWLTSTDDVYLSAASYTGSNGINSTHTFQASGTTATISSVAGNMTLAAMAGNGGAPTVNFNTIFVNAPFAPGGGASYQAGAATNAHTFSGSGATIFAVVGIDIVAASTGASASIQFYNNFQTLGVM